MAKGFRKKYFSLQAVTATASSVKLSAQKSIFLIFQFKISLDKDELNEDPPPEIVELLETKEPCPCRCKQRKSGLSPPFFL